MLDDKALATIFRDARTHNGWLDKPVISFMRASKE